MSNRFTEQLLTTEYEVFLWSDACETITTDENLCDKIFYADVDKYEIRINEFEHKLTMVSLLAVMSDNDIDEFIASFK